MCAYRDQSHQNRSSETNVAELPSNQEWPKEVMVPKVNVRALAKEAATYELENFEKNYMLVFNHTEVFGCETRRDGTERDVEELKKTFGKYGFEVDVEHDLKKRCIINKLRQLSKRDFTNYGCVAVAVLTHGRDDGVIMARDMLYSELEIVDYLHVRSNPTLLTKPRILIVQACRGEKSLKGITTHQSLTIQTDSRLVYSLPDESDLLLLHSSYFGKLSHRHLELGSWFIQSLCSKINQLSSTLDLESILTEVKREVAIERSHEIWNARTMEFDINKQMPVSTSTLTRKLYLRKFRDAAPMSLSDFTGPGRMSDVVKQPVVEKHRPETLTPSNLRKVLRPPIPPRPSLLRVHTHPQPPGSPSPPVPPPLPQQCVYVNESLIKITKQPAIPELRSSHFKSWLSRNAIQVPANKEEVVLMGVFKVPWTDYCLKEPLKVGTSLQLRGTPRDKPMWFILDLRYSSSQIVASGKSLAVRFKGYLGADPYCLNSVATDASRPLPSKESTVVIPFSFLPGQEFKLDVLVEETQTVWLVNGEYYRSYPNRTPRPVGATRVEVFNVVDPILHIRQLVDGSSQPDPPQKPRHKIAYYL